MAKPLARKRFHPWYYHIAEAMLAKGGRFTLQQLAQELGCNPNTLTRVLRSDAWKRFWDEFTRERRELLNARLTALAHKGLDELLKRIEAEEAPLGEVRQATALALQHLGFGAQSAPSVTVNVGLLEEARARILEARPIHEDAPEKAPAGAPVRTESADGTGG